ncbi:MAG TPA: helix-turn-helix domain-containing protein [Candidatus Acidoferrum sp.]|nr:helix-turn-helix domain-containing protein [Candidatus Acidoferrum sp.]
MSDAVDRLAQALSDLINEAAQAAVEQDRPTPPPVPVVERPKVSEDDLAFCSWCDKKHMRRLLPITEARHLLGGISPTTFYALVKEGELSLVKIGRRSFVHTEDLDDFLRRKRHVPGGEGNGIGADRS